MATLNDWYAQNQSRIDGLSKANNVDLGTAKAMLVSNITGKTNYQGAGVGNIGQLNAGYQQALYTKEPESPTLNYYDKYLADSQKALQASQAAAEEAARIRTQQALGVNNAYIPQVNQQSDKQLQEAYISYMKGKRQAPEALSSMGYTGGAAETSLMGLDTNYQGVRGDLETARNQSLDQIRQNADQIQATGNADLSDLAAKYYDQYVNLSNQALQNAKEQENMDRNYNSQTESDALTKAKLAASYGDYSLLKELGINPQMEEVGYSGSPTTKTTKQTATTGNNLQIDTSNLTDQQIYDIKSSQQRLDNGRITDEQFLSLLKSIGAKHWYE